jgi:hypothetical protein
MKREVKSFEVAQTENMVPSLCYFEGPERQKTYCYPDYFLDSSIQTEHCESRAYLNSFEQKYFNRDQTMKKQVWSFEVAQIERKNIPSPAKLFVSHI